MKTIFGSIILIGVMVAVVWFLYNQIKDIIVAYKEKKALKKEEHNDEQK